MKKKKQNLVASYQKGESKKGLLSKIAEGTGFKENKNLTSHVKKAINKKYGKKYPKDIRDLATSNIIERHRSGRRTLTTVGVLATGYAAKKAYDKHKESKTIKGKIKKALGR